MRYAGAVVAIVFAAGCGSRTDLENLSSDADVSGVDGSTVDGDNDASASGVDGGVSTDSGTPGLDSGTPGLDSATPGLDSATPGLDSGTTSQDSGAVGGDSGSLRDSGSAGVDSGSAQDSGSASVDSAAPGDSGGTAPPVVCGNSACDPGAECCLVIGTGTTCTPAGACPGVALPCTGTDNCATGQMCCINLGGAGGTPVSSCQTGCAAQGGGVGLQLCSSNRECPNRETCLQTPLGVSVCVGLAGGL